jgi:hypothetical protein
VDDLALIALSFLYGCFAVGIVLVGLTFKFALEAHVGMKRLEIEVKDARFISEEQAKAFEQEQEATTKMVAALEDGQYEAVSRELQRGGPLL